MVYVYIFKYTCTAYGNDNGAWAKRVAGPLVVVKCIAPYLQKEGRKGNK